MIKTSDHELEFLIAIVNSLSNSTGCWLVYQELALRPVPSPEGQISSGVQFADRVCDVIVSHTRPPEHNRPSCVPQIGSHADKEVDHVVSLGQDHEKMSRFDLTARGNRKEYSSEEAATSALVDRVKRKHE